ncbi:lipoprotein [Pantoea ananatis]|uniref:Rz1-like lysis system protein LysC n=1 Tax=Pantoea ananas TaxID=553 RepID=UPI001575C210|nr:lipoprotein [Pantoea ananatis]
MKKLTSVAVLLLALTGCTHTTHQNNCSYIQENLLQQCSTDTPIPKDGTGGEVLKTINDWQAIYNDCNAGKHA